MDLFKEKNNNEATSWDWNCPKFVRRSKGDTKKLHRLSRKRLKRELNKEISKMSQEQGDD